MPWQAGVSPIWRCNNGETSPHGPAEVAVENSGRCWCEFRKEVYREISHGTSCDTALGDVDSPGASESPMP